MNPLSLIALIITFKVSFLIVSSVIASLAIALASSIDLALSNSSVVIPLEVSSSLYSWITFFVCFPKRISYSSWFVSIFSRCFLNNIARESLYYLGSRAFCVAVLSSFYVPVLGNIFATSNFTSMSFTGDAIHAAIPAFTHFLQVIHDPANSSRDFAFLCHSYHFAPQYA